MMSSDKLLVNEAALLIENNASFVASIWAQSVDCYRCNMHKLFDLHSGYNDSAKLASSTNWNIAVRTRYNDTICEKFDASFGEHGVYDFFFNDAGCSNISVLVEPIDQTEVGVATAGVFLISILVFNCFTHLYKKHSVRIRNRLNSRTYSSEQESIAAEELVRQDSLASMNRKSSLNQRIRSLDVFRGIAIAMMIFVDYGGAEYTIFQHAAWNGVTLGDFVFPWFAWVMGVSISLKTKSQLRNSVKWQKIMCKIGIRSVLLLIFGLILSNIGNNDWHKFRIPGILQRLAISYFVVAMLESKYMKPQSDAEQLSSWNARLQDLSQSVRQWIAVWLGVAVYLTITFGLQVPGCPRGYIGPGGAQENGAFAECTGGSAGYLDRLILGETHLYQFPTCGPIYGCRAFDPEGLLGIFTTILCVSYGTHAGRILLTYKSSKERISRWLIWFLVNVSIAGVLCGFSKETGIIPLNKNLWSLSYVLLCSGVAFLLLSLLYFVIDHKKWISGFPFYQTGMNSLLLFAGICIFSQTIPWNWEPLDPTFHVEYLVMHIWGTILWIIIAFILYKRSIFVTV